MIEVRWKRPALRDVERLDKPTRQRIHAAIDTYAATGRGDVKRLAGEDREYRLRVGHWRVRFVFEQDGTITILLVLRVLPRGDAYGKKGKQ